MELILVRHGETEWNKQRRIQGCRSDTGLSPRGREQADKLAAVLRKERIDAIYSSPLKRALETAQTIAEACGLPVQTLPELREIDAGQLDGLLERELTGPLEAAWNELCSGNAAAQLPEGESLRDLQKRTSWAVDRMLEKHIDGNVVVVAHLLANLAITCQALDIDIRQIARLKQGLGSITILDLTTQGNSLVLLNDTCHLQP